MAQAGEPAIPGHAVGATRRRRPLLGAALVTGAAALWATFGIFAKVLYDAGFQPLELASVRAAVGFLAIAVLSGMRLFRGGASLRVGWRAAPFFLGYGALGYALFTLMFFGALARAPVSIAVALLYTAPAFVLAYSAVLWREHVTLRRGLALLLVLAGVVLVTGAAGAVLRGTATLPPPALAFGIAAGATYALYTVFSKVATERYGPGAALFWSFAVATLVLGILAPPHAPFLRQPGSAPLLLALGIVPTLLPYTLYLAGLRELRASTASMLASVEPVIATILAALLLGERLEPLQGLGMLLVVSAAVLLAVTVSDS